MPYQQPVALEQVLLLELEERLAAVGPRRQCLQRLRRLTDVRLGHAGKGLGGNAAEKVAAQVLRGSAIEVIPFPQNVLPQRIEHADQSGGVRCDALFIEAGQAAQQRANRLVELPVRVAADTKIVLARA